MALAGFDTPTDATDPTFLKYGGELTPEQKDALGIGSTAPGPGETQEAANYAGETGALGRPGSNLISITDHQGHSYTVNRGSAGNFEGFVNDLEDQGYKVNSIGGYAARDKRGGGGLSEHAYGNAIDINPGANPWLSNQTDLPENIRQLAAKHQIQWGGDFKSPGPDPMHFEYDPRGPGYNSTVAKAGGQPSAMLASAQAPAPEDGDWSAVAQRRGGVQPQPTAPQTAASPVQVDMSNDADWSGLADRRGRKAATNPVAAYGPAMTGPAAIGMPPSATSAWQDIKDWFAQAPAMTVRGMLEGIGFPGSVFNAASDWFAQHPMAGTTPGAMPAMPPPGYQAGQGNLVTGQGEVVSPQGPHVPIDARSLISAMEAPWFREPGLDLRTPDERGDKRPGMETGATVFRSIGAGLSPGGIVGRAGTAIGGGAAGALKAAGRIAEHDLLLPGLGGELASEASDVIGDKYGSPAGQVASLLAGSGVMLGRAGLIAGGKALGRNFTPYQRYVMQKFLKGNLSAGGIMSRMADNPEAARFNLDYGPGGALPEGFQVPAATETLDAPIQGAFQHMVHADDMANGQYRKILTDNTRAIEGALGSGGDPAALEAHLAKMHQDVQDLIHMRLSQAQREADVAEEAARTTSAGQKLTIGGPESRQFLYNKSADVVQGLRDARDDLHALADDQWDVARQAGLTKIKGPTQGLYDQIEARMGRFLSSSKPLEDFPFDAISRLYKSDPRQMFDDMGKRLPQFTRRIDGANHDLARLGPTATLEELHDIESNLGEKIRAEQDAISTPGSARGNPSRLANLVALRGIVRDTLDRSALQGGAMPAALAAARGTTRLLHDTFDSGVVGKILNTDIQSQAVGDPGVALRQYLANGERGVGSARAILDATQQRTGMAAARDQQMAGNFDPQSPQGQALMAAQQTPIHPAVKLQNDIADWLRQDFLNARERGGPAAAQQWLDNHSEFFQATHATNGSPFPKLQQELEGLRNADTAATMMNPEVSGTPAAKSLDEAQQSAMALYLGGDPGRKIDAALKGDPYAGMRSLIDAAKKDPTGHAFNGLVTAMFDRTLAEGKVFDDTVGHYYSGRQMMDFRNRNAGAFQALKEADPIAAANMQKMLNAADQMDRIMSRPQIPGAKETQNAVSLSTIGRMFAQIGFAKLASKGSPLHEVMHAGPMQGPALLSGLGGKIYDQAMNKMNVETATTIMRDALFDPNKMRLLLTPAADPVAKAEVYHQLLEPYLRSAVVEGAQPIVNPEQRPNTAPDIRKIGGVPQ